MKVLVTGSRGFVGSNLVANLRQDKNIKIVTFDRDDDFEKLQDEIADVDFIFHLAGVNRPENEKEFYEVNTSLTNKIIDTIKDKSLDIPILLSSSTHALKDTDYGKSKKQAENLVLKYMEKHQGYVYRLNNVFGKWCRPNYNSVIATFCHNIANNIDIKIDNPNTELELVYIDDVVEEFINALNTGRSTNKTDGISSVKPVYKIKLGEVAELIKDFKKINDSIYVPQTGDDFKKKLYSTFISYVQLDNLVIEPKINVDERGFFSELIKTNQYGQISIATSKPGIVRGNHYHHTKVERFVVVKGKAKISFRHILTNVTKEYYVDDKHLKIINIPVGYTHNIENIGKDDMVFVIWCNEELNIAKPDTYFMKV